MQDKINIASLTQKPVRRNGFCLVFGVNYFQVISWSYFLMDVVFAYFQIVNLGLDQGGRQQQLYQAQHVVIQQPFKTLQTKLYQINNWQRSQSILKLKFIFILQSVPYEARSTTFCLVCNAYVQESSKHCGSCNKQQCTSRFDHHCVWLNNCVGDANYKQFVGLVSSLFLLQGTKLALNISFLQNQVSLTFTALTILSIIFNTIALLSLVQLILMHVYLKFKKMTTYDFIRYRRSLKMKGQKQVKMQQDSPDKKHTIITQNTDQIRTVQTKVEYEYGLLMTTTRGGKSEMPELLNSQRVQSSKGELLKFSVGQSGNITRQNEEQNQFELCNMEEIKESQEELAPPSGRLQVVQHKSNPESYVEDGEYDSQGNNISRSVDQKVIAQKNISMDSKHPENVVDSSFHAQNPPVASIIPVEITSKEKTRFSRFISSFSRQFGDDNVNEDSIIKVVSKKDFNEGEDIQNENVHDSFNKNHSINVVVCEKSVPDLQSMSDSAQTKQK